jgi:hypothetical protein
MEDERRVVEKRSGNAHKLAGNCDEETLNQQVVTSMMH